MKINKDIRNLPVDAITVDPSVQSRASMWDSYIKEFGEAMARGDVFPPVVVFFDGKTHWLADGFHRHAGAKLLGIEEIAADVRRGTKRDALICSVGANIRFSIPRTPDDLKRATWLLLEDSEWFNKADRTIGKHCGIAQATVRKHRVAFCHDRNILIPEFVQNEKGTTYKTNRDGKPRIYPRKKPNGKIAYQASVGGKTVYLGMDKEVAEAKLSELAVVAAKKQASKAPLTIQGVKDYLARSGLLFTDIGINREYHGVFGFSGHSCHCTVVGTDDSDVVSAIGRIAVMCMTLGLNNDDRFIIICEKTKYQSKVLGLIEGVFDLEYLTPDELIESIKDNI